MFGHDLKAAFRWFCHWTFEVSRRGPGQKVFYADELWHFADAQNLPGELDAVRPYFRGVDRVADLPRGSFIAYNRESGEELAGKLF